MGFQVSGGSSGGAGTVTSVASADTSIIVTNGTSTPDLKVKGYNPRYTYVYDEHFMAGTGIFALTANSGAGAQQTTDDSTVFGMHRLSTQTSASAAPCLTHTLSTMACGGSEIRIAWRVKIPTASDGTEDFTVRVGAGDSISAADHVDGIYFEYNHAVNSGQWVAKTSANSSRTSLNSNVAIDTANYQWLEFVANSAGTSVEFFINGTSIGTTTTNIPLYSSSRTFCAHAMIQKSAGTTARFVYIDRCHIRITT